MKSKKPAKRPRLPYRNVLQTRRASLAGKSPPPGARRDHVCAVCGRVTRGPHRGEHVPNPKRAVVYKGCDISHGLCAEHKRRQTEQAKKRKGR